MSDISSNFFYFYAEVQYQNPNNNETDKVRKITCSVENSVILQIRSNHFNNLSFLKNGTLKSIVRLQAQP